MGHKFSAFVNKLQTVYRWLMWVIVVGGFVGIIAIAIIAQGFPWGFLSGLLMGTIFAALSWWRLSTSLRRSKAASTDLRLMATGQYKWPVHWHQVYWSWLGLFLTGLTALALILSCTLYSCLTDLARPRIAVVLLGFAIVIDRVFREERVTGRTALVVFVVVCLVVVFLIARILGAA